MSEPTSAAEAAPQAPPSAIESPPPSAQPARSTDDPRGRLHSLAQQLMRTQNRRLLSEYLTLRRATR